MFDLKTSSQKLAFPRLGVRGSYLFRKGSTAAPDRRHAASGRPAFGLLKGGRKTRQQPEKAIGGGLCVFFPGQHGCSRKNTHPEVSKHEWRGGECQPQNAGPIKDHQPSPLNRATPRCLGKPNGRITPFFFLVLGVPQKIKEPMRDQHQKGCRASQQQNTSRS